MSAVKPAVEIYVRRHGFIFQASGRRPGYASSHPLTPLGPQFKA